MNTCGRTFFSFERKGGGALIAYVSVKEEEEDEEEDEGGSHGMHVMSNYQPEQLYGYCICREARI